MLSVNSNFSFLGTVETICQKGTIVTLDSKAVEAFEMFENNEDLTEICIVDLAGHLLGVLTRNYALAAFGGRYGFDLNQRRNVYQIMSTDMLVVDANESIENVSNQAMSRPTSHIYDAVIVLKNSLFYGVVSIKDLLTTVVSIQVEKAADANPLTELPGNRAIEEIIDENIKERSHFTVIYLDLDNFKAYNDSYGFTNGDNMIRLVADSLKSCCDDKDFIGHIGGDDFVIVSTSLNVAELCHRITVFFDNGLKKLYSIYDWQNGFITSVDRKGNVEQFPIASLSIAAITSSNTITSMNELSRHVASLKKKAKQINGNSVIIQ